MFNRSPTAYLCTLFLTSVLLLQGCSEDGGSTAVEQSAAPDFDLELFEGGRFKLSEQRGRRPVVINFFASWCVSCGKETPVIEKVSSEMGEKVAFLGIAVDDTEKKAKEFMKKIGLTIPAGLDRTGKIKEAFGLYGMPTTFFIDKQGMVSYFHAGVVTEKLLKHEIGKIL